MLASPVMRTCDNTQYLSISKGDVKNADGILFSVPTYRTEGAFQRVDFGDCAYQRSEASLLGVPMVVVTSEDALQAQRDGWHMPEVSPRY